LEIDKEILKGYIDTIILSLLCEKPLYGFEMAKIVREKSHQEFELKEGTMYLALKRLENNGLVEFFWGEEASEGGRRKYYRILPLGKERLIQKKAEWEFVKGMIDLFLEVKYERD
jgi:PadR family transcriptional regulator, regulatory protein PadR